MVNVLLLTWVFGQWNLTGTPLQNRVGDLYSLVKFLRADPFSFYFCKQCDCKSLHWKFSDHRNCDDCGHKGMSHFCWFAQSRKYPTDSRQMRPRSVPIFIFFFVRTGGIAKS